MKNADASGKESQLRAIGHGWAEATVGEKILQQLLGGNCPWFGLLILGVLSLWALFYALFVLHTP